MRVKMKLSSNTIMKMVNILKFKKSKFRIFLTIFNLELYPESYKPPNSMQNNHDLRENSIKREFGMDVEQQLVNKDDSNLCYRGDKFQVTTMHQQPQKNDYKR